LPGGIATGDFNADNKPDIAVTLGSAPNGKVAVVLGTGTGSFGAPTTYTVGASPDCLTIADLNLDGKPDIIVSNNYSSTISVLRGTGNGTFLNPTHHAVGTYPHDVISADFNADGNPDIATANSGSQSVTVLLGAGTGSFSSVLHYTVNCFGATPVSLTSADFNKDGKPDLAVTSQNNQDSISVMLGTGSGSFPATTNYKSIDSECIISTDFNGDGNIDLAVSDNNAGVHISLGNGSGGFAAPIILPDFCVSYARMMLSSDFNADGKPDIATANADSSNISIHLSCSGPSGIALKKRPPVKLYPNPSSGIITIDGSLPVGTVLELYRADGQLVQRIALNGGMQKINLTMLANGLYGYSLLSGLEVIDAGKIQVLR
jgi:hypothetical protein